MFSLSRCSFSTKVIASFFVFILFFILIRFFLVIPKVKEESYNNELHSISEKLLLVKEQLKMVNESIGVQKELEISLSKKESFSPISKSEFETFHEKLKAKLKIYIQKNINTIENSNNAKVLLLWLNPQGIKGIEEKPLFEKNKHLTQQKYRISEFSTTKILTIGTLSAKQLLDARDKEPIEHIVAGEKFLSWVFDISFETINEHFIFIYTIKKDDILKKSQSNLFVLLPETLIAISIAFLIIIMIFRGLFRNINQLTNTAIKVNQGNKNIRSNVRGEDDIGSLGKAFDSMLDFFENSIKTLDLKVEEKTKEISKSLEEKELLLKEIHHRVKNNLALTIGLIELQEEEVSDKQTKKTLIDIQERIYTMELLHRKLYESKNLNEIPFDEYVKDLVYSISNSYDMKKEININIKTEKIELNIEKAMPLGLVINELITNAFKYAFVNNKKPSLEVEIFKDKDTLNLIVKDNGKGLAEDFEKMNDNTLGLKLINTIVYYQLFGNIEYTNDNGAKFIVSTNIKREVNN